MSSFARFDSVRTLLSSAAVVVGLTISPMSLAQGLGPSGAVSCDDSWCNDGNPCTMDVCTVTMDGHTCSSTFDATLEGDSCTGSEWAEYCSGDGVCGAAFAIGEDNSCPSFWCNDGDASTTDICSLTDAFGGSECSYIGAPTDSGDSGDDDTDSAPPGGPAVGVTNCPADWCSDGNPCTMDSCTLQMDGSVDCASAFDTTLEGDSCTGFEWAEYCSGDGVCGAAYVVGAPNSCPAAWCADGDPTTTDVCTLTDEYGGASCSDSGPCVDGSCGTSTCRTVSECAADDAVVQTVISAEEAFAALLTDGSVVAWGDDDDGGNPYSTHEYASPPLDPTDLASGVVQVVASEDAFAALKSNGSVVAWGDDYSGGNPYSTDEDASPPLDPADLASGVVEIVANDSAFAALKIDGSVVAWGNDDDGGNPYSTSEDASPPLEPADLASGVVEIVAAKYAFAALKEDGSVVAWGYESTGGNAEEDGAGEWGPGWFGAPAGSLDSGVVKVVGANYSFAAIKDDGSVVAWGRKNSGGNVYASGGDDSEEYMGAPAGSLDSDVVEVIAGRHAFAALKSDGSVVTWGKSSGGGNSTTSPGDSVSEIFRWMPAPTGSLDSGVVKVVMHDDGFAALKDDGSVVVWGGLSEYGLVAYLDSVASELLADVVDIRVRPEMYGSHLDERDVLVVFKSDGRVILVGPPAYTDSTTLDGFVEDEWGDVDLYAALPEDALSSGVVDVAFTWGAGAVLKDDGSVVTWGRVGYGGGGDRTDLPVADDTESDSYTMAPAGSLSSGVVEILGNDGSFSARKADGSVVTWGQAPYGGDSSAVATALDGLSSEWAADCPPEAGGTCTGDAESTGGGDLDACIEDCNGDCDGTATEDSCGVCDDDPTNDNTSCCLDLSLQWTVAPWTDPAGEEVDYRSSIFVSDDGQRLVVPSAQEGIQRSMDGGQTWSSVAIGEAPQEWTTIAGSPDGTRLVLSSLAYINYTSEGTVRAAEPALWLSSDSGDTWSEATGLTPSAAGDPDEVGTDGWVAATSWSDGEYILVTDHEGVLWKSSNYGADWTMLTANLGLWMRTLSASHDGGRIVATNWDSGTSISLDGGETWDAADTMPFRATQSVVSGDGSTILASSWHASRVLLSFDDGVTWEDRSLDGFEFADFGDAAAGGPGDLALSYDGQTLVVYNGLKGVLLSQDAGLAWSYVPLEGNGLYGGMHLGLMTVGLSGDGEVVTGIDFAGSIYVVDDTPTANPRNACGTCLPCKEDCNGVLGGGAFYDMCGDCVDEGHPRIGSVSTFSWLGQATYLCDLESEAGDCSQLEAAVGCPLEAWDTSQNSDFQWVIESEVFDQDLSCWDLSSLDVEYVEEEFGSVTDMPLTNVDPSIDTRCEVVDNAGVYSIDCIPNGSCIECTDGVGCTAWACDAGYTGDSCAELCAVANASSYSSGCTVATCDSGYEVNADATACEAEGGATPTPIFLKVNDGENIYQFDGSSWVNTGLDGSPIQRWRVMGRIGDSVYFSTDTNVFVFDGTSVTDTGIPASYNDSNWHQCTSVNDVLYCEEPSADVIGHYEHYTFDGSMFSEHPVIAYEGDPSGYHPLRPYNYCTTIAGKAWFIDQSFGTSTNLYTFDGSELTRVRTLELGENETLGGGYSCFGQQGEQTYLTSATYTGSGYTYARYLMDVEGNLSLVEEDAIPLTSDMYFGEVDGVQYYSGWDEDYNPVYYSFVDGSATLLSDWIVADTFPDDMFGVYGYMSFYTHCHGMC